MPRARLRCRGAAWVLVGSNVTGRVLPGLLESVTFICTNYPGLSDKLILSWLVDRSGACPKTCAYVLVLLGAHVPLDDFSRLMIPKTVAAAQGEPVSV